MHQECKEQKCLLCLLHCIINQQLPANLRHEQKKCMIKALNPSWMLVTPRYAILQPFFVGGKPETRCDSKFLSNAKVFGFCCWAKNGTLLLIGRRASFTNVLFQVFLRPENFISNRPNHALASFTDYPAGWPPLPWFGFDVAYYASYAPFSSHF